MTNLPVNRWTLLPASSNCPSPFGALVYAPDRGQVLYWGRSRSLLAFDAAKGGWISEVPRTAVETADGEKSRLAKVYHGVCWDSKRQQIVYTVPGLMAAYASTVLGFGGGLEPYNGRFFPGEVYFSALDTAANTLTVNKVTSGPPCRPGEDRPFCFMADRDQVFYFGAIEWK